MRDQCRGKKRLLLRGILHFIFEVPRQDLKDSNIHLLCPVIRRVQKKGEAGKVMGYSALSKIFYLVKDANSDSLFRFRRSLMQLHCWWLV